MKWDELQFVLNNKHMFKYDNAVMGGSDNSTDPSASGVNPNAYLASDIGGRKIRHILITIALILLIVYLFKRVI